MLNRKELFHRDLPTEEAKAVNSTPNADALPPTEAAQAADNRFLRNNRPRILSNDFVGNQNTTSSNRRNLIHEGPTTTTLNRRAGSQKSDNCKTVKIVKGKSLTIKSEQEVLDGKYKDAKHVEGSNQNTKAANESDGSTDSHKIAKDLPSIDNEGKNKRNEHLIHNAQVKVVNSSNLN